MKRGEHHGALRQALIDAAFELLDADGSEAVTIRAVARAAQVSHAAPANHFSDRRALLTGIAIDCFETLNRRLSGARAAAPDSARARIRTSVDAYLDYAIAHPHRYRLMWRMDILDQADAKLTALVNQLYAGLEQDVARLAGSGPSGATTTVIALSSVVHGYASMRIDGNFVAATDEASGKPRHRAIVDTLIGE